MNVECRRKPGFTLLEMLIVLMVMSIIAAAVLSNSTPNVAEQLDTAAEIVAADLAYTRSLAVTYNSRYRITFDDSGESYSITHSGSNGTLDALPPSPFAAATDPPDERIIRFDDMAGLSVTVRVVSVTTTDGGMGEARFVEFGPLGETTRPQDLPVVRRVARERPATVQGHRHQVRRGRLRHRQGCRATR